MWARVLEGPRSGYDTFGIAPAGSTRFRPSLAPIKTRDRSGLEHRQSNLKLPLACSVQPLPSVPSIRQRRKRQLRPRLCAGEALSHEIDREKELRTAALSSELAGRYCPPAPMRL